MRGPAADKVSGLRLSCRPMSLQALRHWITRRPLAWVLGLALVLTGAQTANTLHEFAHGLGGGTPTTASAGVPSRADAGADSARITASAGSALDCVSCLAGAALSGAAPAAVVFLPAVLAAPAVQVAAPAVVGFTRFERHYASRAPPALILA